MDVILQWFRRTFSNPQIVILCALLLSGPVFLHFFGSMLAPALAAVAIAYLLDGNVLAPLLLSGVTKLHPVAIIIAILVFGGIWGFWGVFFAIPLATLVNAVLRAWRTQTVKTAESAG